jgi:hypothetical protein
VDPRSDAQYALAGGIFAWQAATDHGLRPASARILRPPMPAMCPDGLARSGIPCWVQLATTRHMKSVPKIRPCSANNVGFYWLKAMVPRDRIELPTRGFSTRSWKQKNTIKLSTYNF